MCVAASRRYPADPSAPAAARHFGAAAVISALTPAGWNLADDVTLLISELVTSAVIADASAVEVLVDLHRDRLDVTVTDDRPGGGAEAAAEAAVPESDAGDASPAIDAARAGGRIVAAISTNRGVHAAANGRTATWARLPCDPRFTAGIKCEQPASH
jgi:anti-sigma regulatory factor (Ser/Thr protein kinase)